MTRNFFFLRRLFLLLFTLGCSSQKHDKKWKFTFPQSINAVRHSDVEIPCTFTAPDDYRGEIRIVWYEYSRFRYPIVYSEDSSEVTPEYRGRTSLIGNGTHNCSLRITDITKREWYYPGVSEKINSYILNDEEAKKAVQVKVPGCTDNLSCKNWGFNFPQSIEVLKGSCVEIPCKLQYPDNAPNFTLFWYKNTLIGYPKIFNSRNPMDVEEKYKGRTSLVGHLKDSCSLRINDVQKSDEIYPGINEEINGYNLYNERVCKVSVTETPCTPIIKGAEQMKENVPVHITCSVDHTCASSPPSITWNKPYSEVTIDYENLNQGLWRIKSTIKYVPSYKDDITQLECTVTFPNNETSRLSITLDIKYKPKNVTISVVRNIQPKEDDNVTLECTSQANPPVTEYTWYDVGKSKILTGTGKLIILQNVTSLKYICSARSDMGSEDSSVFSFIAQYETGNEEHKNILIIGATVGFIALAVIILVVIFCLLKRRKRTSIPIKEKKTQENVKDEQSIVYTSVEVPLAKILPKTSRNTEETEYAELNI